MNIEPCKEQPRAEAFYEQFTVEGSESFNRQPAKRMLELLRLLRQSPSKLTLFSSNSHFKLRLFSTNDNSEAELVSVEPTNSPQEGLTVRFGAEASDEFLKTPEEAVQRLLSQL